MMIVADRSEPCRVVLCVTGLSLTAECQVACKVTTSQLQTHCRHEGIVCLDLGVNKRQMHDFEVEYLCDYKRTLVPGRKRANPTGVPKEREFYLVKWKRYPDHMNTWEPRKNLRCVELLRQFWDDVFLELQRQKKTVVPNRFEPELSSYLEQRARHRQSLQRWEAQINSVGGLTKRILVRNRVDLEGPPKNFTYINGYKVGEGISVTTVAVGCECTNCLENPVGGCCPGVSGHGFSYNECGQVTVKPGQPIYECNKKCRCGPDCPNRVVQRGIQHTLCIFKTDNGRGWGVRASERIKKHSFVMEYVGEIITTEEAERRGQVYDRQGATYLFDLDYVEDEYTVDAARYGNVSHFVNHSCNPNLQVYNVFIDNLDERLPRLAFFSNRGIRAGEELTFDYNMQIDPIDVESTKMDSNFSMTGSPKKAHMSGSPKKAHMSGSPKKTHMSGSPKKDHMSGSPKKDHMSGSPKKRVRMECKCGNDNCRGYLF
ncbi:histone-lysine N-methyltransferase SUV39H1 isoform X1 [Coregonus clupeaformis]|uniref:histone-lysine N-methyltransferase SUV39H1 isoform X1 n=1 Tax=Coregonus clupeaformis TaxID=59861 RepID=UPI001BE0B26D|nr:histone-lysine N-methyltransferase SUV39H1 isoform X1 [Coregonus clupeaformis]